VNCLPSSAALNTEASNKQTNINRTANDAIRYAEYRLYGGILYSPNLMSVHSTRRYVISSTDFYETHSRSAELIANRQQHHRNSSTTETAAPQEQQHHRNSSTTETAAPQEQQHHRNSSTTGTAAPQEQQHHRNSSILNCFTHLLYTKRIQIYTARINFALRSKILNTDTEANKQESITTLW